MNFNELPDKDDVFSNSMYPLAEQVQVIGVSTSIPFKVAVISNSSPAIPVNSESEITSGAPASIVILNSLVSVSNWPVLVL